MRCGAQKSKQQARKSTGNTRESKGRATKSKGNALKRKGKAIERKEEERTTNEKEGTSNEKQRKCKGKQGNAKEKELEKQRKAKERKETACKCTWNERNNWKLKTRTEQLNRQTEQLELKRLYREKDYVCMYMGLYGGLAATSIDLFFFPHTNCTLS